MKRFSSYFLIMLSFFTSAMGIKSAAEAKNEKENGQLFVKVGPGPSGEKRDVVVVDIAVIAQKADEFRKVREEIETDLKDRSSKIEEIDKKIQGKVQELKTGEKDMTSKAREKRQEELAALYAERETKARNVQSYVQRVSKEAEMRLINKLRSEVESLSRLHGWKIVLPGGALYVQESYDKTDMVLDIMNKKYALTCPKKKEAHKNMEKKNA